MEMLAALIILIAAVVSYFVGLEWAKRMDIEATHSIAKSVSFVVCAILLGIYLLLLR